MITRCTARSRFSCAIFIITTSRSFITGLRKGYQVLSRNILVCSRKLSVSNRRRKTLANVTQSRSTEASNVPRQFPPHYRRICGNGILIERCLLSLNAMARVTSAHCELGTIAIFCKQIRRERAPTDARVKLVIQSHSPRRALIIVIYGVAQTVTANRAFIRDISVDE